MESSWKTGRLIHINHTYIVLKLKQNIATLDFDFDSLVVITIVLRRLVGSYHTIVLCVECSRLTLTLLSLPLPSKSPMSKVSPIVPRMHRKRTSIIRQMTMISQHPTTNCPRGPNRKVRQ
jgi:hypothetical protein